MCRFFFWLLQYIVFYFFFIFATNSTDHPDGIRQNSKHENSFKKMAEADDDSSSDYSLHKCVFEDDIRKLSQLLRTNDVSRRDKHGN